MMRSILRGCAGVVTMGWSELHDWDGRMKSSRMRVTGKNLTLVDVEGTSLQCWCWTPSVCCRSDGKCQQIVRLQKNWVERKLQEAGGEPKL